MRTGLIVGYNVDRLDIDAGMRELSECGWPDSLENSRTRMVIQYCLQRWARGEEEAAQRGAVDIDFHGITLTCWYRVLAAAKAGGARQEGEA